MEARIEGRQGLEVIHKPNPCDQHQSDYFPRDPFPFMWYYRTEVRNNTNMPLRVVWFEAYRRRWFTWVPGNVTGRELTNDNFQKWYGDGGNLTEDGSIPAGESAVCAANWHGGWLQWSRRVNWAFKAVDEAGSEHFAEAEVRSSFIWNVKSVLLLVAVLAVFTILLARALGGDW